MPVRGVFHALKQLPDARDRFGLIVLILGGGDLSNSLRQRDNEEN